MIQLYRGTAGHPILFHTLSFMVFLFVKYNVPPICINCLHQINKQKNVKTIPPQESLLKDTMCHSYKNHICIHSTERQDLFWQFLHQVCTRACPHTHTPTPSTMLPEHLLRLENQQNLTFLWLALFSVVMSTLSSIKTQLPPSLSF